MAPGLYVPTLARRREAGDSMFLLISVIDPVPNDVGYIRVTGMFTGTEDAQRKYFRKYFEGVVRSTYHIKPNEWKMI